MTSCIGGKLREVSYQTYQSHTLAETDVRAAVHMNAIQHRKITKTNRIKHTVLAAQKMILDVIN